MKLKQIMLIFLCLFLIPVWFFILHRKLRSAGREFNQRKVLGRDHIAQGIRARDEIADLRACKRRLEEQNAALVPVAIKDINDGMRLCMTVSRAAFARYISIEDRKDGRFSFSCIAYFEELMNVLYQLHNLHVFEIKSAQLDKHGSKVRADFEITCFYLSEDECSLVKQKRDDTIPELMPKCIRDPFSFADEERLPDFRAYYANEFPEAYIRYKSKDFLARVGAVFEGWILLEVFPSHAVIADEKNKALQHIIC